MARKPKLVQNTALKLAIVASETRQRDIARSARIHETRLSHIVRGRLVATDRERKSLARVLRLPVEVLFVEPTPAPRKPAMSAPEATA